MRKQGRAVRRDVTASTRLTESGASLESAKHFGESYQPRRLFGAHLKCDDTINFDDDPERASTVLPSARPTVRRHRLRPRASTMAARRGAQSRGFQGRVQELAGRRCTCTSEETDRLLGAASIAGGTQLRRKAGLIWRAPHGLKQLQSRSSAPRSDCRSRSTPRSSPQAKRGSQPPTRSRRSESSVSPRTSLARRTSATCPQPLWDSNSHSPS